MPRSRFAWFVWVLVLARLAPPTALAGENAASIEAANRRLAQTVRFLASDQLEGRGVGTPGIDQAAQYIAGEFAALGLKTQLFDGTPFQTFRMTTGVELGSPNQAAFVAPPAATGEPATIIELKIDHDFNPFAIGGSGKFDLPLVFAGYGITSKEDQYDDYAGIDVKNKAVIVLRHEPQQDNPHGPFQGTQNSPHAPYVRKLSNAYEHGAAAVIFCTDDFEIRKLVGQRRKLWRQSFDELAALQSDFVRLQDPTPEQLRKHWDEVEKLSQELAQHAQRLREEADPLIPFAGAGPGSEGARIPVLYCRRAALDPVIKAALGTDLAALQRQIDEGPQPHSRELPGWRVRGEVNVRRIQADVKNVVAVLEGQGPLAEETIVVGAHYDHLGRGGEGSLAPPESRGEIHNGADDNASGAAALLEVARRLASSPQPPPRRIVFIAFTGEERGLIGSARYCKEPLVPLENTVAMLNMDMVGRLDGDKLIIQGVDTAKEFGPLVDRLNAAAGFKLTRQPGGFGPSDHSSFYGHKIPVMHFFTGTHKDYHRPTDDFEKINVDGVRRVAELVGNTALALAELPTRPTYQETKRPAMARGGGDRPYFGSIPDFSQEEPGYALAGVAKDGPADRAGLRAKDIIIQLGDSRIGNLEDFDSALRKHKAGERVPVVVKRDGKEVTLTVKLDAPR